jgi:hypothetical protein
MINLYRRYPDDITLEGPGRPNGKDRIDNMLLPDAIFENDPRLEQLFEPSSYILTVEPFTEPFTEAEIRSFGFEY